MNYTNLGGHSGCTILLCESEEGENFVRKISAGQEYNDRLIRQCEKQQNYINGKIKTPRVLNTGYTDFGLFYFDMEYIQGITLSEYIKTLEVWKIHGLVEDIVKHVVMIDNSSDFCDGKVFIQKISNLKKCMMNQNSPIIMEAVNKLEQFNWKNFKSSFCHGDLTLENIIIKNNEMYLIDFLDSFYNSWILDIGKLMQDVQTMWSYRKDDNINTNTLIRLIVFRDILLDSIKDKLGDYIIDIYYALLLHIVRIYPYTKDELTLTFLDEKVKSILDILDSMGSREVNI